MPTSDGGTQQLTEVRYVFTLPKGVEANAEFMIRELRNNQNILSFEIFNNRGERKIIEHGDLKKLNGTVLLEGKPLNDWLYPSDKQKIST